MRRLLLLRHAKAAPLTGVDFDRPLTPAGRAEAARIGAWLAGSGLAPDYCLYSGAARTRETAAIVAAALNPAPVAVAQNALYEASRFLILGLLRELPAQARAALIVGHNPGLGELAPLLSGEGCASDRLRAAARFPTGALAVIAFASPHWSDLSPHSGRLEHFVAPGDL